MSNKFSRKELTIFTATLFLLIVTILVGYFLYLSPKKNEVSLKETELRSEEQLLAALEGKQIIEAMPNYASISEMQKKLPVKQQLEQLILDIEKAEIVSGSFINSMSFSEAEVAVPTEDPAAQNTDQTTEASNTTNSETEKREYEKLPLPEGIKKVTVNLSVKSPGYHEVMKFIETLEGLDRLIVVESVAFAGGKELTNVEDELEEISYSLTLSAFYMPELEDLQEHLPQLVTPEPSNKINPFTTNADLPGED